MISDLDNADLEVQLTSARALGASGGERVSAALLKVFEKIEAQPYELLTDLEKHVGQACLRSLGRLGDSEALPLLVGLLQSTSWARYAADALGDFGSAEAIESLLTAYPRFSRVLDNPKQRPQQVPEDDRFSGDNTQDRMFETPYAIAVALSRLGVNAADHGAGLRSIAPYLLANLPADWDSGMLYQQESFENLTAFLLQKAGLRRLAVETAFLAAEDYEAWFTENPDSITFDNPSTETLIARLARRTIGDVPYVASWYPALSREKSDVPSLINLMDHPNGWMRINAIKALMFLDAREAIEPIAQN